MMSQPRFEGIDFSEFDVKEMNPDLDDLGQGFKCLRNDFATYIKGKKIRTECKSLTSKCWVIECEGKIAGYITLMADKLTTELQLLKNEGVGYKTFPAVKIGWLAADKRARGAGRRLLEWALEYVTTDLIHRLGIRFITVDALYDPDTGYDIARYYERFGFKHVDPSETTPPSGNFRTMYFDIKVVLEELNALRADK
ncbi:GNAT family N-acetyltransferase [Dyadobacter sp. MSC1_007]|jgi:GNAT superfamily N-acetyltransferase|uniref:GNAT family N-acetyltransferase n=1 Tax=Dyadobacter sp. MSC1_007 TaxID=2909264 RepID=UPI00202E8448|nr:GNAT family N-acetyltransferase [Dyadobacter sp. MSC1_007]